MPERSVFEILAKSEEIATEVNIQLTPARIERDAMVVTTERVVAEAREFLDRVSGRSAQRHHDRETGAGKPPGH
jgi:uridine phosphorylase